MNTYSVKYFRVSKFLKTISTEQFTANFLMSIKRQLNPVCDLRLISFTLRNKWMMVFGLSLTACKSVSIA